MSLQKTKKIKQENFEGRHCDARRLMMEERGPNRATNKVTPAAKLSSLQATQRGFKGSARGAARAVVFAYALHVFAAVK